MLSISSPSASLPFVRSPRSPINLSHSDAHTYVVFDVSLNKLLNKPSYDVTVMDDLALGDVSLLRAHYVPQFQCIWNNHADINSKTDRMKELTYEIYVCVFNNCWHNELFSERYRLKIVGVSLYVSIRTDVLWFLPYMVALST